MDEGEEKIIIAGFDVTDYVKEEHRQSMELFGTPSENVTPGDLLQHVLWDCVKTQADYRAIRDEYKANPEKYSEMNTLYDIYFRPVSNHPDDVLAMLNKLAETDPTGKIKEYIDPC